MASQDNNSFGKGFSILLKRYRRQVVGWTQQELANKSGLKLRTIQDLETAQKANLEHETVAKIAEAFELEGSTKEEFFGAAGLSLVTSSPEEVEWNRGIFEFYKSIDFPAFVSDELTEIHSLNSYIIELLEVNLEVMAQIIRRFGSFNAMRFFLDPAFNSRKLYGREWRSYTTSNVWFLRTLSRPYIHTARFQKLLAELQQLEDFEEIWAATKDMPMPFPPYLGTVHNKKYGTVNFWHSSSIRPAVKGEQMTFLFYHPADADSERAFAQIRADVSKMAYQLNNTRGEAIVRLY